MPVYAYARLTLSSILPLPELDSGPGKDASLSPQITVSRAPEPFPEPRPQAWAHHWRDPAGAVILSLARTREGHLLRFPQMADFRVSEGLDEVLFFPAPETDDATLRHLLLDQVLPRVVSRRGALVLHAGAVALEGGAVAFAGPTGGGKSTLTAAFHRAGCPLLADDGLLVETEEEGGRPLARALYPGLRLFPSSVKALFTDGPRGEPMAWYTDKERIPLKTEGQPGEASDLEGNPLSRDALPLRAVFLLAPREGPSLEEAMEKAPEKAPEAPTDRDPDGISLTPVGARDACMALIRHAFQLDPADPGAAARALELAGAVAGAVPVYRLAYPHDFVLLPRVQARVLEAVRGREGAGAPPRKEG